MSSRLLFVYNADSSFFAQLTDYVHKLISPQTYQCNLCKITYGNLGMKKEWKKFVEKLPYKAIFLHRDEFFSQYPKLKDKTLPAVFQLKNGALSELVTAREINQQKTIEELGSIILAKINK
ncbi:hypothetical protein IID21_05115 [Patescibacteria group bacterium]|nr:hypothetical protein [Patescibacteria group bacterium]